MTLVNLTSGAASLTSDIALLNTTSATQNCSGKFWYSSGSQIGLVADAYGLDDSLNSLINMLLAVLCMMQILCPKTTTTPPINFAYTVCMRSIQQQMMQKCSESSQQSGIVQFQFSKSNMYGGVLSTFFWVWV
ncbi:unnamed protein product [Rotaria magnacalcarata]|uniref:Uncharacterized protein n=1 Tax=Rotaria magnacalcarata TaxID=392030 RepID=A0A815NZQ7_9BILA|nr:unnamed protein product [Rotaria magnacalcarata]CAF1611612.1 unnamed protein product [Rotaria magnacalcarata]CAF2058291.1 unnamed protein product [Rotaria magnacalcarata]CAF2086591.1 unnamed protein product [Rotaria magnacalcarata]